MISPRNRKLLEETFPALKNHPFPAVGGEDLDKLMDAVRGERAAGRPVAGTEHMTPVPGFPDYGVCPEGVVWRITPTIHDDRLGSVPRPLSVSAFNGASPSVMLVAPDKTPVRKTLAAIRRLVRASI